MINYNYNETNNRKEVQHNNITCGVFRACIFFYFYNQINLSIAIFFSKVSKLIQKNNNSIFECSISV